METLLKSNIASFDIDAQKSFTPLCPDELPVPEGDQIGIELNLQATKASVRIGSKDAHSPMAIWAADNKNPQLSPIEGKNVDVRWNMHCVPGTKGFELIDDLPSPLDYDYFAYKGIEPTQHPYGACYQDLENKQSTGVIEYLRQNGITTVIAGGLATEYCLKTTVLQLIEAGFSVIVNLGGSRGIDPTDVEKAINEMKIAGALIVNSASEIEAA